MGRRVVAYRGGGISEIERQLLYDYGNLECAHDDDDAHEHHDARHLQRESAQDCAARRSARSTTLIARRLVLVDVGDVVALAQEITLAVRLSREEGIWTGHTDGSRGRGCDGVYVGSEDGGVGGCHGGKESLGSGEDEGKGGGGGVQLRGEAKVVAELVRRRWDSERMCRDELAFYRLVVRSQIHRCP